MNAEDREAQMEKAHDDLERAVERVCDRTSFLDFLFALHKNWELDRKLESMSPSPPYSQSALGWESGSIGQYLEACSAYGYATADVPVGEGMEDDLSEEDLLFRGPIQYENPWREAAQILFCGQVYE